MAIQNRRGDYVDFTPAKMVSGEFAIVLEDDPHASDGKAAYIGFGPGNVKRLATYEDMVDYIEEAAEEAVEEAVEQGTEQAEAWATGKRGGQDVPVTDETYHNNAKYYNDQSSAYASGASGSAATASTQAKLSESYAKGGTNTRTGEDTDNAKYYKQQASISAGSSASYSSSAALEALKSEGYAIGSQNGTYVSTGSPYYHNNAKYFSEQAAASAQAAEQAASTFVVDSALSSTSENPVQNKVIKSALDDKQDELTFDTTPTANSNNPVKSGGIYTALQDILGDFAPVETSSSASKAYRANELLVYNNKLYRMTIAISSGSTITPGTNCVQTTVSDEIANRVLWWGSKVLDSTGGTSGTLRTITDARITADHVLDKVVAADPSVIISDITCVTSAGQAVITGISTAATTAEILLIKKNN